MTPDTEVSATPRWQPAVIVGLIAAVALGFVLSSTGPGAGRAAAPPQAAEGTTVDGAGVAAPQRPPVPTATPAATEEASQPGSLAAQALPEPFVQDFATGLVAAPKPPATSPSAPMTMPANLDGCDHGYDQPDVSNECVPWQFPPGVTDGCRWLADHGFELLNQSLIVYGDDRLGLDPNGDKVACGPGD